ncbi:PLDc N-terminal domain-containing protein [Staphylococcus aureus]
MPLSLIWYLHIIIFLERNRRTASSTWAWLLLFVLPLIGFILYFFLVEPFRHAN